MLRSHARRVQLSPVQRSPQADFSLPILAVPHYERNRIIAEGEMMAQDSDGPELLAQFERDNIKDDYRLFYSIKRNNLFSSIQGIPEHWEFFCLLDEIWQREIGDLEVAIDPDRMFPTVLYINAHAKLRISMELAFSNCMPEARSILRDAVETAAYAHHMLRDPANQLIWMKKDEPPGEKAFKKAFQEKKRLAYSPASLNCTRSTASCPRPVRIPPCCHS
jgi:hypothetical protein